MLGGTGFIGRRLVDYLLREECDVTVATSGSTPSPFGDAVTMVKFDRFDLSSFENRLSSPPYFDVLFDQICFSSNDARQIAEEFSNRIGRYVFVSSAAVYDGPNAEFSEDDFDPYSHTVKYGSMGELGYAEGKRSAEAYLFQKADFPVAAARFPIVMGHDDSTMRFQKHVNQVLSGEEIKIPEKCGKRNYVWVDDAGRFLMWLGLKGKTGPYNAASSLSIDAFELVGKIGDTLSKEPKISKNATNSTSSYYLDRDFSLACTRAEKEGFKFTEFQNWFGKEVEQTARSGGSQPNSTEYFRKLSSGGN